MSESISKYSNKSIRRIEKLDPFTDIDKIKAFVLEIVDSDLTKEFKKGADGKVNPADVIGAISIGLEIGIPPMSAVALGKTLNAKSYLSVLKGRSMGIDPVTSISKIYNIETKNGNVMYTAVDIISKMFLDTNTKIQIIRDYAATPKYYDFRTNAYVGHKYKVYDNDGFLNPDFFIYIKGTTILDDVTNAEDNGKLVIVRGTDTTFVTSIRYTRLDKNIDEIFHLSTQEMIDANLLRGYHSYMIVEDKGKLISQIITGKLNWNDNPTQMLRNRNISIAGRIFVADKLQGIYTDEEVMDMGENIEYINQPIQEAEEVKE